MATCISNDWHLGQRVHYGCRQFDFTLFFEAIFLSAVPSAILLMCVFARLWKLVGTPVKAHGGMVLILKMVCSYVIPGLTGISSTNDLYAD
jgi:hypothetical protein